jgi:hypothetical protein
MIQNPSPTLEDAAPIAAKQSDKPAGGTREQILPDAVYLTDEAARLVRCKPSTIRHAVRTGLINGKGRPFRIRGSELFKLV